jgi:hypothetical protein
MPFDQQYAFGLDVLRRVIGGRLDAGLAASRARFRDAALAYWVLVHSGDTDGANEETSNGDAIVQEWASMGREIELLKPLLVDADPEVRFAAASHLLDSDIDEAVSVLEELAADPSGMIAPTARLRLMIRRRL